MVSGTIPDAVGRIPVNAFLAAAGVLALAVSGLFGGLEPVRADIPRVAAATVIEGGPWRVTVTHARLYDDLPPLRLAKPGDRWLLILATVEVTADESRNDLRDILRLPGVPGLLTREPAELYLSRDSSIAGYLNPAMPERVGFFWEQAGESPPPTEVDVLVQGKTRRASSLTGHVGWLDLSGRAQVRLPVDDER